MKVKVKSNSTTITQLRAGSINEIRLAAINNCGRSIELSCMTVYVEGRVLSPEDINTTSSVESNTKGA